MIILNSLFILFFSFIQLAAQLDLGKDIQKDWTRLQKDSRYFISDNTSDSPTLEIIAGDLQNIHVISAIDLSNSVYSGRLLDDWVMHKWQFDDSNIKAIYQFERTIKLDTVVTNTYLENRPPTQQQVKNTFTFRAYAVSTNASPLKFFYLTEEDQGLLEYKVDGRYVQVNYAKKKEGLSDIMPRIQQELELLIEEAIVY
jgi:hypothetical protein